MSPSTEASARQAPDKERYGVLLSGLIAAFLLLPVLEELGRLRFWYLLFSALLVTAVFGVSGDRRIAWKAALLAAPAVFSGVWQYFFPGWVVFWITSLAAVLFIGYVILVIFRLVVRSGRVTSEKVTGAIAVYLLLGVFFAVLYGIIGAVDPGAFTGLQLDPTGIVQEGEATSFYYFSFVTLTTLGYGDISPLSPWARGLAWAEAVIGQIFLATTIARLVALQIAHSDLKADR